MSARRSRTYYYKNPSSALFLVSCINLETTGSKGRRRYFPVPVNGRIVISFYYGNMAGRFCENDHRVAVSDPDVISHTDPVKGGMGLITFLRSKYRITEFCGKAVTAIAVAKAGGEIIITVIERHSLRIGTAQ